MRGRSFGRAPKCSRGQLGAHKSRRAARYTSLSELIFGFPGLNFAYPSELEAYFCVIATIPVRAGRSARARLPACDD